MDTYILMLSQEPDTVKFKAAHQGIHDKTISYSGRAGGQLAKMKNGDILVIVGHGSGTEVGSSHNKGAAIDAKVLTKLIVDNVTVGNITCYFAVCDSDVMAGQVQAQKANWNVTGHAGTPKLSWPANEAVPVNLN